MAPGTAAATGSLRSSTCSETPSPLTTRRRGRRGRPRDEGGLRAVEAVEHGPVPWRLRRPALWGEAEVDQVRVAQPPAPRRHRRHPPSNQLIVNQRSKPPKCLVSATQRTTTLRVPRSGTPAPTGGEASGDKYDLRKLRPSNENEAHRRIWPQLSAPGATIYDQHAADTSMTATTSLCGVSDDCPSMCAANS